MSAGGWYHCRVKPISRSAGRSVVAAAAYRLGDRLHDRAADEIHDYRRRSGVEQAFGVAPDRALWARDAEALWNAAEQRETRRNATLARECELALPAAVGKDERARIAWGFAQELTTRYGVAASVAIHRPGRGSDRNFHAHILFTTRRVGEDGLGEKTRELDARATGPQEIAYMREFAAGLINASLERTGSGERVDHRSFADRGIERAPTIHLGPTAAALERRGMESERGDVNRETAGRNETLDQLVAELAALDAEIARERDGGHLEHRADAADRQARFAAFEPQAPGLDPHAPQTWPELVPNAVTEEAQVHADAAPFAADIEEPGRVREIEQDGGLTWWEHGAQLVMDAFDQVRGVARDTWERFVGREDRDRDIDNGPDMG